MSFLQMVREDEATGEVAEIYQQERAERGWIEDSTRVLTTRPEILPAWLQFVQTVRGGYTLSERDWRLITLVAAKHVPSTICSLAYGRALIADLGSAEAVLAVQRDFRRAGLSQRDVAMLDYAEQVATAAHTVTQTDIDRLRESGFTDAQIFDIALCVGVRHLFSRLIEGVGVTVDDPALRELQPAELREALIVGRALPDAAHQTALSQHA